MSEESGLTTDFFIDTFAKMADLVEEQRDYWSSLDSAIGDGDHGINLSIGFRKIKTELPQLKAADLTVEELFKTIGRFVLNKVGGAAGPLYGSFFMKMGLGLGPKKKVTPSEFIIMLSHGLEAVKYRGKAKVGDKTLIDALEPGILNLQDYSEGVDFLPHFSESLKLMKAGAESTRPIVARKGRAARLGERSIGHLDPGATSAWMLMTVFYEELVKVVQEEGVELK